VSCVVGENDCAQVAYLDARESRWVEEMGSNNIFFVFGHGENAEVVTPKLSGHILPGVTRDSVLVLANDLGHRVTERKVSAQEWLEGAEDGRIAEVFGSGTTVGISPIGGVKYPGGSVRIGDGQPGPITMRLRKQLSDIQRGVSPDTHHWMHRLVRAQANT